MSQSIQRQSGVSGPGWLFTNTGDLERCDCIRDDAHTGRNLGVFEVAMVNGKIHSRASRPGTGYASYFDWDTVSQSLGRERSKITVKQEEEKSRSLLSDAVRGRKSSMIGECDSLALSWHRLAVRPTPSVCVSSLG